MPFSGHKNAQTATRTSEETFLETLLWARGMRWLKERNERERERGREREAGRKRERGERDEAKPVN